MTSQPVPSLVFPDSLGDTIDAVNAALFENRTLPAAIREEAAEWIADRQGLPGSYAGMFAPTGYDYAFGTLTFTGEPVRSGAATGHILSEEACRALYQLSGNAPEASAHPDVQKALGRARLAIFKRMEQSEVQGQWAGVYCCGMCSVALWRHLAASPVADDRRRLVNGLAELRRNRDGNGRWKRFPYFYTLLALAEMDLQSVQDEIHYAEASAERALRRLSKVDVEQQDKHGRRRRVVLERILEKC